MDFDLNRSIEILESTPPTLSSLLRVASEEWIYGNEGPDTWSPFDVIGHLIHGEQTDWIPRMEIILSGSTQPFRPFDRFAQKEKSKGKTITELLQTFQQLRTDNIEKLKSFQLTESDLALVGTHPELGQVTLKNLIATWTSHDLSHLSQIGRVMAKQLKAEVGPWHQYMKILQ